MLETISDWVLLVGSLVGLLCIALTLIYATAPTETISQQPHNQNTVASNLPTEALFGECLRLREQLEQQSVELTAEVREETFRHIQTLLTNYPSAKQMIKLKPELPAKNLISLLTPLDNLLSSWGYEPIGSAWEQVPYSPQLHQPDSPDIEPGELVYVRFVGYRAGTHILCPAKVSRTLPVK